MKKKMPTSKPKPPTHKAMGKAPDRPSPASKRQVMTKPAKKYKGKK